jgi:hypothetical protein
MKLTVKLTSLLLLLLLASPVILLKGCGSKGGINGGGSSGLCPNSVAPTGSKIDAPTLGGIPAIPGPSCYPNVGFTVVGPDGTTPMADICVVVTTNGAIGAPAVNPCFNAAFSPSTQMVMRTDSYGNVVVDMLTSSATVSGDVFFVEVSSGALSAVANTPKAGST